MHPEIDGSFAKLRSALFHVEPAMGVQNHARYDPGHRTLFACPLPVRRRNGRANWVRTTGFVSGWSGPVTQVTATIGIGRCQLQVLANILDVDAQFISLQKDPRASDKEILGGLDIV